jgi:hypothetical protein
MPLSTARASAPTAVVSLLTEIHHLLPKLSQCFVLGQNQQNLLQYWQDELRSDQRRLLVARGDSLADELRGWDSRWEETGSELAEEGLLERKYLEIRKQSLLARNYAASGWK